MDVIKDLNQFTFNNNVYPCISATLSFAHNIATYKRPYYNGARLETTGRSNTIYRYVIPFRAMQGFDNNSEFDNSLWFDKLPEFIQQCKKGDIGLLTDLYEGDIFAQVVSVQMDTNPNVRNGCDVVVEFQEAEEPLPVTEDVDAFDLGDLNNLTSGLTSELASPGIQGLPTDILSIITNAINMIADAALQALILVETMQRSAIGQVRYAAGLAASLAARLDRITNTNLVRLKIALQEFLYGVNRIAFATLIGSQTRYQQYFVDEQITLSNLAQKLNNTVDELLIYNPSLVKPFIGQRIIYKAEQNLLDVVNSNLG
jgi:hypothetical protein